MRKIDLIVIHCSATRADRDFTEEDYGVTAMSTIQERFNSRRVSQQVTEVYYDILR